MCVCMCVCKGGEKKLQLSVQTFFKSLISFLSSFFSSFQEVFADYKANFTPKVSLAKWGFMIYRTKKFSTRCARILLTVDGITVTRGESACTHFCTHIGALLYVSANLIPFLSLWERMDTPHSLVSQAFAESELKEHHFLNLVRIFLFHSLRAHLCAFVFSLCTYNMFWKSWPYVGRICSLMNLELTFLSRRLKVLLFAHFNLLKFLTLYLSWKLNSL